MFGVSRQDIAEAVTGTWGGMRVIGHGRRPSTIGEGDAWATVAAIERGPGDAFLVEWNLTLVLSSDELTAMDQVGAVLPALVAQVEDSGTAYVSGAVPIAFPTQAGELFAVQITMRSE